MKLNMLKTSKPGSSETSLFKGIEMLSKSAIRSLKNKRCVVRVWDSEEHDYVSEGLQHIPAGPHAPGGKEAKLLRRLMSETGLTEEKLREHKKYRVMLSEAQKSEHTSSGMPSRMKQRMTRAMKAITRAHPGIPKEHPLIAAKIHEAIQNVLRRDSLG